MSSGMLAGLPLSKPFELHGFGMGFGLKSNRLEVAKQSEKPLS
jgi:hypothetical protein